MAAEDDPSVVLRPRFEKNGANLELVRCQDQAMIMSKDGLPFLRRELYQHGFKLVVIDPIVSFLGQQIDASKAADVRAVMGPLHELAREFNCAIVLVRHWNKSSTASASQRGSGSVDFRNAARSVLQVIKAGDKRYVTLEKSNYGVDGKTLSFSLDNKLVVWNGPSDLSADEILRESALDRAEAKSELEEAIEFLQEELSRGPVLSKDIEKNAVELGISKATLRRAKTQLGVKPLKEKGRNAWMCELPSAVVQGSFDSVEHAQGAHCSGAQQVEQHEHDIGRKEHQLSMEEVI